MKASVLALFGVVLATALAELLLPEGKGGTRHFLRFLAALAVLLLLVRPLFAFVGEAEDFFSQIPAVEEGELTAAYRQKLEGAVAARSEEQLRELLPLWLSEHYDIPPDGCEIRIQTGADGSLLRVTVYLKGAGLLQDPEAVAEGLSALLGCETEVW